MNINEMIEEQTYKALTRVIEKEERKSGIHVSDLKSHCLRKSYYGKVKQRQYDLDEMLRMSLGTLIHEFKLAPNSRHEEPLEEWNGIIGTPDEVWNGIVIDKKTTRSIPDSGVRAHHRKQLEMYGAMLDEMGHDIIGGAIIYIGLSRKPEVEVMSFPLDEVDFDNIRNEMLEKKTELEMCLEVNEPPERNVSWLCQYCNYIKYCMFEDSEDDWDDVEDDNDG